VLKQEEEDLNKMANDREQQEAREKARESGLSDLRNNVYTAYAAAFYSRKGFGEQGERAVHDQLYAPAIKEGEGILNALHSSRIQGELYSGNVSELGLLQYGAKIINEALLKLKAGDIAKEIGYAGPLKGYEGKWIADMIQSKDEKEKGLASTLMQMYLAQFTEKSVGEALIKQSKTHAKNLEEIVKDAE